MSLNPTIFATEGAVPGRGGFRLFLRQWRPAGTAKAAVVICPGFNGHSGQYGWAAEQLVSAGCSVYALDLRGRGKSEGERFFVRSFNDYVDDLAAAVSVAKGREADVPLFILGHSAGGVVACAYAVRYPEGIAGLICESFAFSLPAPDFALSLISFMARLAPRTGVLALPTKEFSRDLKVVAALDADPMIRGEKEPAATVAALVAAAKQLDRDFKRITLPVLILHGGADKLAKPDGSRKFAEKAASADKTLKIYEGHVHDLLADFGKDQVAADIVAWIKARMGKPK
jgi:acylglycerol lipase